MSTDRRKNTKHNTFANLYGIGESNTDLNHQI